MRLLIYFHFIFRGNYLILKADGYIKRENIACFTDSEHYYASEVKISGPVEDFESTFRVIPVGDGHYWCAIREMTDYQLQRSNTVLYIRSEETIANLFACKILFKKGYRFNNLDKMLRLWKKKLEEYLYYRYGLSIMSFSIILF